MAAELPTASAWGRSTMRKDAWWVQPVLIVLVLGGFVVYATFRVFENAHYSYGDYHSPFGNPDLTAFLPFLAVLPFTVSPAMILLPAPAGLRFTCYYYRRSYYRAFAGMPPSCAVSGTTNANYRGERGLMIIQNLHRYFLYLALVVLLFNLVDAVRAFGLLSGTFFVGVGSILFGVNALLLSAYTLGCHSLRHLLGGRLDCYSCDFKSRLQHNLWAKITVLNERHMLWAWVSLVVVALTDLYVRGLSAGWWTDVRLI